MEEKFAEENERKRCETAEAVRLAIGTNNQTLASEIREQNEKSKAEMTRLFNEQHSLVRELAEVKHAQQLADHLRTRQLQEVEYQQNLRTFHERASADIQFYSQKQAAVELQVRATTSVRTQGSTGGKCYEDGCRWRRCLTGDQILCGCSYADHIQRKELVHAVAGAIHER